MSNKFQKNLEYPEEIYFVGERMDAKENKEGEDLLITKWKAFFMKK
jgi:hypothetical protein